MQTGTQASNTTVNQGTQNLASLAPDQMLNLVAQLSDENTQLTDENTQLRQQVAWFKRQVFGQKSERRLIEHGEQGTLGENFAAIPNPPIPGKKSRVEGHERQAKPKHPGQPDESSPFFDETKVPVEVIQLPAPEAAGLSADEFEVIGEKCTYRLAQRPGSYVVIKYARPVIKLRDSGAISCAPAPLGVIEGSRADVSFVAGVLIDKFAYHLPLYRQHQRTTQAGIRVTRPWFTQLAQSAVALLAPIAQAQLESIQLSRVKAMDETPIKAGLSGPGKMKNAYFWPVYGELDEVSFLYYPDRSAKNVQHALGLHPPPGAVLLTDGYSAYRHYANKTGLSHAQCWAHTRRTFDSAKDSEPKPVNQALDYIGALYAVEQKIRDEGLTGQDKLRLRQDQPRPIVDRFFKWIDQQFDGHGFLPQSLFTKALSYARERKEGLEIYLSDADVQIDTNHLERALRTIPMGKKNWLFCWTELGAKHVAIVQSLLVTCKLHDIDPYDYLVDVLQRVGQHPASKVQELTPRRWKALFANNPLRSDLHNIENRRNNAT
jgi:transposase